MKTEEIRNRIQKIIELDGDNENQHIFEDDLFYDFVYSIKNGSFETKEDIIVASKELYKVREIRFPRWHT